MKQNDIAQRAIREYIARILIRPSSGNKTMFMQESYSRWAAIEMLMELRRHPDEPPLCVMEAFRDKMDRYSCMNPKTSYMFSIAKDISEVLIDLLIK